MEALAGLARTLAQTPDTDGSTMLDNTAIVFVPDNGEQHHSTASDFPTLLLGGNAMGLRTDGRTVIYPGLREGTATLLVPVMPVRVLPKASAHG